VITTMLGDLRQRVKEGLRRPVTFISDTHVPTFALLAGHDYASWARASDALSPLLSHLGSHYLENFAALAHELTMRCPEIDEATGLSLLYRLSGYDRFALPTTIAALGVKPATRAAPTDEESALLPQLEEIVGYELRQARLLAPPDLPSYPVLMGETWPAQAIELGHDGVIFQSTAAFTGEAIPLW
jgi:hypothetical protein